MKIIYIGNFSQRHCTEVHLALTLEDLGHEVIRYQEDELKPDWVLDRPDGVDLVLYTRTWGNTVTLEHLEELKKLHIPTASYHLDLYVGLKREDGLDTDPFWKTDFVFTPDGSDQAAEVFKSKGINHHYIKPGVYKLQCYTAEVSPGEPYQKIRDVLFVGGGEPTGAKHQYGHPEWGYRGQLLEWLEATYGECYTKFGFPQETIRNESLNDLYASSKVVVGDSLCLNFDHPYYWSDRVYETMGRGGFIIHPFITGMDEEFEDGENIVFYEYNNWTQLKEKIDYYLEHDDEREKIRLAGHEFVKNYATYHDRLKQMLGIISDAGAVPTPAPVSPIKISLGAGSEPEYGFVNVDIVELPGIDVVHNLMQYPWPFEDNSASYIKAKDIIEHMATHLPDGRSAILAFVDECYRILEPGGILWIQTPGWKSEFAWIDVTHTRPYDVRSFDFLDSDTDFGRATGFYTKSKFKVEAEETDNHNLIFELRKI